MNSTTLRGIFPDPKPVHRKNFVRENMRQIKHMQGIIHQQELNHQPPDLKSSSQLGKIGSRYKNIPSRVYSNYTNWRTRSKMDLHRPKSYNNARPLRSLLIKSKTDCERRFIHRGVQTDRAPCPEDTPTSPSQSENNNSPNNNLIVKNSMVRSNDLQTQTVNPTSASAATNIGGNFRRKSLSKQSPDRGGDSRGDKVEGLAKNMQGLALDEKKPNYIKENIKNLKPKPRAEEPPNPNLPPATYQKGVLPKYLNKGQSKEETKPDPDSIRKELCNEDMPGLVLLPDEERREYLRVARENYAGLIKELNSMPVRNDTLKKRKRKMEIEEELKRLDEVIKIFQKPKVFVKADN